MDTWPVEIIQNRDLLASKPITIWKQSIVEGDPDDFHGASSGPTEENEKVGGFWDFNGYYIREQCDDFVRLVYNQCMSTTSIGSVINSQVVIRQQYSINLIRKLMLNIRYLEEVERPGPEEEDTALFTVLMHLYSFVLLNFVP